jgi:hypothetical protein
LLQEPGRHAEIARYNRRLHRQKASVFKKAFSENLLLNSRSSASLKLMNQLQPVIWIKGTSPGAQPGCGIGNVLQMNFPTDTYSTQSMSPKAALSRAGSC